MPREFVHWLVVDAACERLTNEPVKELMREHRAALLLGAMAPDAPYYFRLGTVPGIERVAEKIHGSAGQGGNSFDTRLSAISIATAINNESSRKPAAVAFLFGFISHLITDSIFHPFIFFLSGDYYHPDPSERLIARRRHRAIEVLLDRAVFIQGLWRKERSMLQIFNQADVALTETWKTLDATLAPELSESPQPVNFWRSAFWHMACLQKAFSIRILGQLFCALAKLAPEKLGCLAALFNYQSSDNSGAIPIDFSLPIVFKNPVTGISRTAELMELLEQAIVLCRQVFEQISLSASCEISNLPIALEPFGGVSLNYGLKNATHNDAKFYQPIEAL